MTHTLCRELAEGLGGSLDYMVKEDNAQVETRVTKGASHVKILEKGHSGHWEQLVPRPQVGCVSFLWLL